MEAGLAAALHPRRTFPAQCKQWDLRMVVTGVLALEVSKLKNEDADIFS